MSKLAIIGGTGLASLNGLEITGREIVQTPYGEPSGVLVYGKLANNDIFFMPRHGAGHTIPPHKVNYRANLWVLKQAGVEQVIAVNAVGGIHKDLVPGRLVIPDQIIDYTTSRPNTYFEESLKEVVHIDFTDPYCEQLRQKILTAGKTINIDLVDSSTYAATEGPRLETRQEINRLQRDGCDIVGMTGMPEAALARELELCYACIAVVANAAAGRGEGEISMDAIEKILHAGIGKVRELLEATLPTL